METGECSYSRLKREDCKKTNHDSSFTDWEVLIGPSDWENHSLGKNGIERYRTQNLPISSYPGVYEIGIAPSHTDAGRRVRKLDPNNITVVYLGKADNIKPRLQEYGRTGSHLDHGILICHPNENKSAHCFPTGPGFFKEAFSKGYSIVFRWAPTKSKKDAEKKEAQLLDTFDYAWNKGRNGTRRPDDIYPKLSTKTTSSSSLCLNTARKPQQWNWVDPSFGQGREGFRIKISTPLSKETNYWESTDDLCTRIVKYGVPQPRSVSFKCDGVNDDYTTICGVNLGDGSLCRRRPIEGRKRCEGHKGKKITNLRDPPFGQEQVGFGTKTSTPLSKETNYWENTDDLCTRIVKYGVPQPRSVSFKCDGVNDDYTTICGVNLGDGSLCRRRPTEGRKRCEEHKGKRITESISTSITEWKSHEGNSHVCGVDLGYGCVCMKVPVQGRKRCELHKGRRVTTEQIIPERISQSDVCGVNLEYGYVCMNLPVQGRKRCELHKGRRVITQDYIPERTSLVCGVGLQNGSVCMRAPVSGRVRCAIHKGRRV